MRFFLYGIVSILILFLDYRVSLAKGVFISLAVGAFILMREIETSPYEALVYVLFVAAVPFVANRFRKSFDKHKGVMRKRFEKVKVLYESLVRKDNQEIKSNLEKEKRLKQVLSLYEISKDMSVCLVFEDIFNIFSSTMKKSFRFKFCRCVLLNKTKDIDSVYQIEIGQKVAKVMPDDFDKELVDIAFGTRKMISISPQENEEFLRRLSLMKSFETLLSIPLFVEEKIAGVLYIENIPRVHFESFTILSTQFAIQFQKVILYKTVQEMSITDSLTEISTRRYFLERLREEIRRSMRHKLNLSFLMLDLDHFKETNDKFGHLVGDVVLKEVSAILKSDLREIDVIGRYGGEEFSILLTGIDREGAYQVAERIRKSIEGAVFKAYDEVVTSTVSIGIAVFPDDGIDIEPLIESADKALYKAKESGRNRVC